MSTPDHWHAVIAIAAMRAGKHVYSQKPMAHSVWEARQMAKVAQETGRANAVSIFNAQTPESRRVIDMVRGDAIGPVHRVDIWTTRASAFWKQGLRTPETRGTIPAGLNWDMWLGPASIAALQPRLSPFCVARLVRLWVRRDRRYGRVRIRHHRAGSRAWPSRSQVYASSTELFPDCYPVASTLHYRFPQGPGSRRTNSTGTTVGSNPSVHRGSHSDAGHECGQGRRYVQWRAGPAADRLHGAISAPAFAEWQDRPQRRRHCRQTNEAFQPSLAGTWDGAPTGADMAHYMEWIKACHGGPPASTNYEFERPIVESLMLGNIAIRTQELLEWDTAAFRLTRGSERATSLLTPHYRPPWSA